MVLLSFAFMVYGCTAIVFGGTGTETKPNMILLFSGVFALAISIAMIGAMTLL